MSAAVRRYFVTTRIDHASTPPFTADKPTPFPGPDLADRIHTAAWPFGDVTVLLTRNQRDFPFGFLAAHGVTVSTADEYLNGLLRRRPAAFLAVVRRLADDKQHPPLTPCDLAEGLGRAGAIQLSASMRQRLACP